MEERWIDIPVPSGTMETFISHPTEGGPFPAVVLYMDVWGLREELCDIARRIAAVGYYVALPDFYHRQGRVRHDFRDASNRMISVDLLDDARKAQVLAPLHKLADAMVVEDTRALLAFLDGGEPVRGTAVGSVGWCMGGRHVVRVAAAFPERFKASVCLHGTGLVNDRPDSPHLDGRKAEGELYCGFGEKDRHTPPALIDAFNDSMRSGRAEYRCAVHPGADHGYALPDRDVFDKRAADRDWEIAFAMFDRQLRARTR